MGSARSFSGHDNGIYTLSDFIAFNARDEVAREFHNGLVVIMESPTREHQIIVQHLFLKLSEFFIKKSCTLWMNRDVSLLSKETGDRRDAFFQPDLFVLCDSTKDDGKQIHGAPDLVIEVWSEGNKKKERAFKHRCYEEAHVPEIWEIDYISGHVVMYCDEGCGYSTSVGELNSIMESQVFPELSIDFSEIVLS